MMVSRIQLAGIKKNTSKLVKLKLIDYYFENKKFKKKFSKNAKYGGLWLKSIKKKTKKNPLISIIMPNYKSRDLEKSINSVLNQNYKNIELILVDGDLEKNYQNIDEI